MAESSHRREIASPLKTLIVAWLSVVHSASSFGREDPRNKTLDTLNYGTSSARYNKMHKANKACEDEEDFRGLCHNFNVILHQIIDIVCILGVYFESDS